MPQALVARLEELDWSKATPLRTDYRRNEEEGETNDVVTFNRAFRFVSTDGQKYPVVTKHGDTVGSLPFSSDTLFVREETILDKRGNKLATPKVEYSVHEIDGGIPTYLENRQEITSVDQITSIALAPEEVPVLRRPRQSSGQAY